MNLQDSSGQTALHAAAKNGTVNIVTYLLEECKVSPFVRARFLLFLLCLLLACLSIDIGRKNKASNYAYCILAIFVKNQELLVNFTISLFCVYEFEFGS